jgi:hypothetical protein
MLPNDLMKYTQYQSILSHTVKRKKMAAELILGTFTINWMAVI